MSARAARVSDPRRNALLAKLPCAKKALGLSDEDYRTMNRSITGLESAGAMTIDQIGLVLDHLRKKGLRSTRKIAPNERPGQPQENLIWALWKDLARLDALANSGEPALRVFVKRLTGCDALAWLTAADANKVIEGLKAWRAREQKARKVR